MALWDYSNIGVQKMMNSAKSALEHINGNQNLQFIKKIIGMFSGK